MVFLGVMIAQLLFKILDKWWMMQAVNTAYQTSYLFPYLYGPLVWLFAKNLTARSSRFAPWEFVHFKPFLLAWAAPYFRDDAPAFEFITLQLRHWGGLAMQLILLCVYHFFALRQCRRSIHTDATFSDRAAWVRQFLIHSWWICSAISILLILIYQTYPHLTALRFGFILLSIFIYWVSYAALNQPALFFPVTMTLNGADTTVHNGHTAGAQVKKYANSPLKASEAARIVSALEALAHQRFYTDPNLSIEKLSEQVQTSRHTLSQVLNERLGKSFFEYLNELRVEEAKRLLRDPASEHLKIAAIAYDAGFHSLSVFNDVFKKQTGNTPSDFRKNAPRII